MKRVGAQRGDERLYAYTGVGATGGNEDAGDCGYSEEMKAQ